MFFDLSGHFGRFLGFFYEDDGPWRFFRQGQFDQSVSFRGVGGGLVKEKSLLSTIDIAKVVTGFQVLRQVVLELARARSAPGGRY